MEHFVKVCLGEEESSINGQMTRAVSKVAEAAEESAKTGMPVNLEWTKEEIPNQYF